MKSKRMATTMLLGFAIIISTLLLINNSAGQAPTDQPYTPAGRITTFSSTIGPGQVGRIQYPHWIPFHVTMSELWASSGATGFIFAAENDCGLSWVGLNGDGTVTRGHAFAGTHPMVLTVNGGGGPIFLRVSPGCIHPPVVTWPPSHFFEIDAMQSREGVRVTVTY